MKGSRETCRVAPPVGAWIETVSGNHHAGVDFVAPPVGAWIETVAIGAGADAAVCRSPRGGVD